MVYNLFPNFKPAAQPEHLSVVDDDREIGDLPKRYLTKHGTRLATAQANPVKPYPTKNITL